jgi:hypothetical protein
VAVLCRAVQGIPRLASLAHGISSMKYLTRTMNPISVIVIFAGLSEASATGVLPYLDADTRQIYIWFLIAFPSALVLMFFLTLNFNHKALYGPSSCSNKQHFPGHCQFQAGPDPELFETGPCEVSLQRKETLDVPQ